METSGRRKSPRTARIKAAEALKKVPVALLLKKKAECDARALKIVERMLEPEIEVDWLLKSLFLINKSHMEDIAEERSIVKLCGYVLCDNPLTKVAKKQYQISTARNKVYDLSKVQNYCSYSCYRSADYLMEQMLTSPLWLRDQEEIPTFRILPRKSRDERCPSPPGVEVDLTGIQLPDDSNEQEEKSQTDDDVEETKEMKVKGENRQKEKRKVELEEERRSKNGRYADGDEKKPGEKGLEDWDEEISIEKKGKEDKEESSDEKTKGKKIKEAKATNDTNRVDETPLIDTQIPNTSKVAASNPAGIEDPMVHRKNQKYEATESIFPREDNRYLEKLVANPALTSQDGESSKISQSERSKTSVRKDRPKERRKSTESKKIISLVTLTSRVEKSFTEWITEKTVRLLHGESMEKEEILENSKREEKYTILCKKLGRLQFEEEQEAKERLLELKPAPNFSALQEEAKKMELKIRAYWKGKTTTDPVEVSEKSTDQEENQVQSNLPLMDLHAPNVLRRRIFLDKLNTVLPDLLRVLGIQNSDTQISYNSERSVIVKALVGTFSFSASNIIFKTAEWTLIALIIIKLLAIMDPRTKFLLSRKQASSYISMILMSYKLDSNYLDNLIESLTSPLTTRQIDNTVSPIV